MMPEEKKFILFPENLNVSLGCPSLQMICYIAGNFEAGNSLNLAVTELVGQHSQVTVHCYPLTSQSFAMLPAERFWRETVSLVSCHVTLKRPMRAQAVGKRIAFPTKSSEWTTLKRGSSAPANANCSSLLAEIYFHKKNLYTSKTFQQKIFLVVFYFTLFFTR